MRWMERGCLSAISLAGLLVVLPGDAQAACGCSGNPGTITSDTTGPCLRVTAPSGAANSITFRFNQAYACGQYATGEYFVSPATVGGKVTLTDITPKATGRHGVAVNPSGLNAVPWDKRLSSTGYQTLTFPYAASAGSSVVKYVSDNPTGDCDAVGEKSCGRFAAALTVVAAAPANPAKTFRPPYVGTYKPTFTTDQLQTQFLSRIPRSQFTEVVNRTEAESWVRGLRLDYTNDSVVCDLTPPEDNIPYGRPWATDMWMYDTHLYAWLNMGNVCDTAPCSAAQDLAAKQKVLVAMVQHGIDVWANHKMGSSFWRGGGGNGGGKLLNYAFAAAMLQAPEMLADLAQAQGQQFFETGSYYRGVNGVALWGQEAGSEEEYWADLAQPPGSTKTIRDPYGLIDGGGELGGAYQDNTAKPTQYTGLVMRLMPALAQAWPAANRGTILEYTDRWVSVGAWTKPDVCAPVTTWNRYGVDFGPDGQGSCIRDTQAPLGRVPESHGANQNGGNRTEMVGEQMWSLLRGCVDTCSCSGQSCAVPPTP